MTHAIFKDQLVVELANVLAGPSVGMFLAECGARVIKVENIRTKGDVTRSWKLPDEDLDTDISAYFTSVNWGKESIGLDLKKQAARDVLYRLVAKADIVLSSYLPGQAEKLGVDTETLLDKNPGLLIGQINGYGPDQSRPAYDAIIQAEAGFTYMNGHPGQQSKMPVALMDVLAAHQLKQGLLLAYIERLQTGKGKVVTVSLMESAISGLVNQATNWLQVGHIPQPQGSEHPNIVPYGTVYTTADKLPLVLAVGNDKQFRALLTVLGLALPAHFTTNPLRVQHRAAVNQYLQEGISKWKRLDLLTKLMEVKVPSGAVHQMPEVMALSQAQNIRLERDDVKGLLQGVFHSNIPPITPPPHVGEHTEEVMKFLAYEPLYIQELKDREIVM
ncbi:MAG: CoA transferase [Bacteroidota bacterium]